MGKEVFEGRGGSLPQRMKGEGEGIGLELEVRVVVVPLLRCFLRALASVSIVAGTGIPLAAMDDGMLRASCPPGGSASPSAMLM